MKNLECSSRGDKRFSAFYCFVNFNGKYASIEQHYQKVKFNKFDKPCCKGEHVAYICINNKKLPATYLTPLYRYLWHKYLTEHPELVNYAKQFNTFTDMFRGHSINCQADCIKAFVQNDTQFFKDIIAIKRLLH